MEGTSPVDKEGNRAPLDMYKRYRDEIQIVCNFPNSLDSATAGLRQERELCIFNE